MRLGLIKTLSGWPPNGCDDLANHKENLVYSLGNNFNLCTMITNEKTIKCMTSFSKFDPKPNRSPIKWTYIRTTSSLRQNQPFFSIDLFPYSLIYEAFLFDLVFGYLLQGMLCTWLKTAWLLSLPSSLFFFCEETAKHFFFWISNIQSWQNWVTWFLQALPKN